jgi:hypothetical protein
MFPEFEVRDLGDDELRYSARDKRATLYGLVLREYSIVTLVALVVGLIVLFIAESMAPVFLTVVVTIWVGLGRTVYKSAVMLEMLDADTQRTPDTADFDRELLHPVRVAIQGNSFQRDKEIDPIKEKERIARYKAALEESRQKDEVARSEEDSFFKRVFDRLMRLLYT